MLSGASPEIAALLRAIGAPSNVTALTLHVKVDEPLTVELKYIPRLTTDEAERFVEVFKRYELAERKAEDPCRVLCRECKVGGKCIRTPQP